MIIFIYGTTAEAIKVAPIMRRLAARGVPYEQWVTLQHTDALRRAIPELGLNPPDRVIANGSKGRPLKTPLQMVGWMLDVGKWTLRNVRRIRRTLPADSLVVVHGDTVTTVLGTVIGRLLGVPVAHVEAGLRSGDWRHPFPEELDRRIVGRLAQIHYAPSPEAAQNLAGRRGVVLTHGNTAKDGVRDSRGDGTGGGDAYGLVLLHRFEFISNTTLVRATLQTLDRRSAVPLRLIVDSYSRDAIEQSITSLGLTRLEVTAKLEHSAFVEVLRGAEFIVTDSGGIQEEAAVVGVPTLVHRKVSERHDGFGTSAVLSGWDQHVLERFLDDPDKYRVSNADAGASPSDIIVDDLVARGYARPTR
ncbi:UDP-N-acetylglucosamine 2-epimerase [Microbacterium sp. X-17]|uniref:UDP-N-acetylglucosamine 2-epimerase n=1 Tax=Microbacterium sp. X-17 TaxID=3144404 RepID=UPI0031F56EE6